MIPLEYQGTKEVREMLAKLGRTEDLKLSPSKKLLAIAGFDSGRIFIFAAEALFKLSYALLMPEWTEMSCL